MKVFWPIEHKPRFPDLTHLGLELIEGGALSGEMGDGTEFVERTGHFYDLATGQHISYHSARMKKLGVVVTKVAGITFYRDGAQSAGAGIGRPVVLMREPDNSHDEFAVAVRNAAGKMMGHLPEGPAGKVVAKRLDAGEALDGVVCFEMMTNDGRRRMSIEVALYPRALQGFSLAPKGAGMPPTPPPAPVGVWAPDPAGRHELRYFDGTAWTHHVGDTGVVSVDPL